MKRSLNLLLFFAVFSMPSVTLAASFDATVQWAKRATLSMPVSGVVDVVNAEAGEHVAKGRVLVALRQAPFKAKVDQAKARVARLVADRREAVRDYKQAQELYDRTVLSTVELENAKLKVTRARAALKEARAELALATIDLRDSRIVAPFDAWVLAIHAQPGQTVVSTLEARPLVVLAAQGKYVAKAWVAADALEKLKVGQAATVTVSGKRYQGRIKAIGLEPAAQGGDKKYAVSVLFNAPDTRLPAGQSARVKFQ